MASSDSNINDEIMEKVRDRFTKVNLLTYLLDVSALPWQSGKRLHMVKFSLCIIVGEKYVFVCVCVYLDICLAYLIVM